MIKAKMFPRLSTGLPWRLLVESRHYFPVFCKSAATLEPVGNLGTPATGCDEFLLWQRSFAILQTQPMQVLTARTFIPDHVSKRRVKTG